MATHDSGHASQKEGLRKGTIGVLGIVFFVVAAAAPLAGMTGAAITPFVLGRIADATAGRSIPANLALAENNASVAAEVAVALSNGGADAQPVR
jgi:pseudouridine-5'-phosphate glycosidase